MKLKLLIILLSMAIIFGVVSQSMGFTTEEKMTPPLTEEQLSTESRAVPPDLVEKKDLKQINNGVNSISKNVTDIQKDVAELTKDGGKFDQVTNSIGEMKKGVDKSSEATNNLTKTIHSTGENLSQTITYAGIGVGAILIIVAVFSALIYRSTRRNRPSGPSEVTLATATREIPAEKESVTNEQILQAVNAVGEKVKAVTDDIATIPGKTADLMDMWFIDLKNVCGRNVSYQPPLKGKRLSLHVPLTVKGDYPDPADIPRKSEEKLTDMKKSVVKTLTSYFNKEYDPDGLQVRVIIYAVENGELIGVDLI